MTILRLPLALALLASLTVLWLAPACAEPADQVSLDVRGLDIDNLLQFYSRTFGLTVIKDPTLTGPVTIMCPQPVSQQEALALLNSVLEVRGFTCVLTGVVLKIVPMAKAVQSNVDLAVGREPTREGDLVISHLVPLKSADAVQLQNDLAPLISSGASLVANSPSNTLIITDYASNVARLLQIIEQLDSANAMQLRVFPLTYAQAEDVAQLLTQVVFTQPRTATTSGAQQPAWQRRLAGALAASGMRAATTGSVGQVVADTRTNSLLVSTSKERMDALAEVIQSLDRPIERKGNLTIVPLQRANAQDVANALSQALGGRASTQTRAATTTSTTAARQSQATRSTALRSTSATVARAAPAEESPDPEGSAPARAQANPADPEAGAEEEGAAPPPAMTAPALQTGAGGYAEAQAAHVIELGGNASVVAEPNSNSLIITADPEYALLIRALIEELDQAPPQVLIEAVVAEVGLDTTRKLGFEWAWTEHPHLGNTDLTGTLGTDFGLAAETDTTGLSYAITGSSLSTLLHALATDDSVTILSTPRIFTSNNRPAEINISTQTPYVASVRTTDTSETFAVQYLDVGVILSVTPQISPDGTVSMQVTQQANELLGFEEFGPNVRAPTVARRSAEATIRVADGQTIILGGIISDTTSRSVDKVPLLGDLPLLGELFRHSTVSKTKSELLVLLTPRVVRTPEEAAALTQSERDRSTALRPAASPAQDAH